jgi:hypothetical protein
VSEKANLVGAGCRVHAGKSAVVSDTIYGTADIATLLGVTRAAIGNYKARHADTPPAQFSTLDGREFWSVAGMRAWLFWQASRTTTKTDTSERARAIEALRAEILGGNK